MLFVVTIIINHRFFSAHEITSVCILLGELSQTLGFNRRGRIPKLTLVAMNHINALGCLLLVGPYKFTGAQPYKFTHRAPESLLNLYSSGGLRTVSLSYQLEGSLLSWIRKFFSISFLKMENLAFQKYNFFFKTANSKFRCEI